jgi:hypothetical protein
MRKKVKLNVMLLFFFVLALLVLIVIPEKSNADTTFTPGWLFIDPKFGIPICDCPMAPVSCFCAIRIPLPPPGF